MYFKTSIEIELASTGFFGDAIKIRRTVVSDPHLREEKLWVLSTLTEATQDRIGRLLRQGRVDVDSGRINFYILNSTRNFKVGDTIEEHTAFVRQIGIIEGFQPHPLPSLDIYGAMVRTHDGRLNWANVDSLKKLTPAETDRP